ncbi:hypothetical protein AB0910_01380 [Streptomyces sp. NPDC047002]
MRTAADEAMWRCHRCFSAVLDRSVDLLRVSSALCRRRPATHRA